MAASLQNVFRERLNSDYDKIKGMREVKLGTYRHFKGHLCEVIGAAKHTETLEELVIYRHNETGELWARPKKMFLEMIIVDGKKIARFEYVRNPEFKTSIPSSRACQKRTSNSKI